MFNINKNISQKLTITVKENIPALTGTVISQQYYLSIKDYRNIVLTINSLIDHLNYIYPRINNLNFSSENNLKNSITYIVTSNFVCITGIVNESGETQQIGTQINVLTSFNINNNYYQYNATNKGNTVVIDNLISGTLDDFVQTFNGRVGDVTGINGVILNGKKQEINSGVVNLDQLSFKKGYIQSINNHISFNVPSIILSVKEWSNTFCLPTENRGEVKLATFIFRSKNEDSKTLLVDNSELLTLQTTDKNNNNSAINKTFVNSNQVNNLVIRMNVDSNVINLAKHYYPLHFYDSNGNLVDLKWSIIKESSGNRIELENTFTGICTVMRVDE